MNGRDTRFPIHVLLAVMNLEDHGGVADQMTTLAIGLPDYGIRPAVLVRNPLAANHAYVSMLRAHDIPVWAISHQGYLVVRNILRFFWLLAWPLALLDAALRHRSVAASRCAAWGVLRRMGYAGLDVVFWFRLAGARFVHGMRVLHLRNPDGWMWAKRAQRFGLRTIYTEDTIPQPGTTHYYQALGRTHRFLDRVTAVSKQSARELTLYFDHAYPIQVIPNMVRVYATDQTTATRPPAHFVIGCLARLVPQKDLDTLLHAFALVLDQWPHLGLIVWGDGSERDHLVSLARHLQIDDRVTFAGTFAKDDLPAIMSQIDLVVMSSIYEGFGVALVEGMAYSKPAIATAVGGVPEVVIDGVTGLLVPPSSPRALADAIAAVVTNHTLYEQMARAARARYLACYTPEQVMPQYVALYRQLAGGSHACAEA